MKKILSLFLIINIFTNYSLAASPQDVIAQENELSRSIYSQLKEKFLENIDPIIIAWSDRISFYHRGKLQEYPFIKEDYIDLKSIAHVTLATFALFHPLNKFPENLEQVKKYQTQVLKTLAVVNDLQLSMDQKARQKIILNKTNSFLLKAIADKSVTPSQLYQFMTDLHPLIIKNMTESTQSLLILINEQMNKIQNQLTAQEKKKLFVVLPGFKTPRARNILAQYFEKYLNEPIDSHRFIYAEGLTDKKDVMALIATWETDRALSEEFFHDPNRMYIDVLADEAHQYLNQCQRDTSTAKALICQQP